MKLCLGNWQLQRALRSIQPVATHPGENELQRDEYVPSQSRHASPGNEPGAVGCPAHSSGRDGRFGEEKRDPKVESHVVLFGRRAHRSVCSRKEEEEVTVVVVTIVTIYRREPRPRTSRLDIMILASVRCPPLCVGGAGAGGGTSSGGRQQFPGVQPGGVGVPLNLPKPGVKPSRRNEIEGRDK